MFHIKNYVCVLFVYNLFMLLDYGFSSQRYRNKPFSFFFVFLENKVLSWPDGYRNIWAFFMENRNQNIYGKYMMPSNVRIKAIKLTTNQQCPIDTLINYQHKSFQMNGIIMRKLWNWFGSGRAFPAAFHLRCIVLLMVCVIRIMFPILWRWGENIESEAPRSFIHINTGVFVCITNFPFEPNKMFGDSFNLFIPFKSKASILLAKMCCKYWCHGKMVFILCLYLNWHLTLFRDSIYQMHSYPWWVCFASIA